MNKFYSVKLSIVALSISALLFAGIAQAQSYDFVRKIGEPYSSSDGGINQQIGFAVDADYNVYVADRVNHRVVKFDSQGNYVSKFGVEGTASGQFKFPMCIQIGTDGNLYVGDTRGVQVFSTSGQYKSGWIISGVRDVLVDRLGNGYIYVLNGSTVYVFDQSMTNLIRSFGTSGSGDGQFIASSMAIGRDGNLYLADTQNHRVQILTTTGGFMAKFGVMGSGDGEFKSPAGIAVDGSGNIYVADTGNARVQIFSKNGDAYTLVRKFGVFGDNDGDFKTPSFIYLDDQARFYVSDYSRSDIQVFTKQTNSVLTFTDVTKTYGDADFKLTATSEVDGHSVVYSELPANSGDITLVQQEDGYYAHIVRAGTVVLRAYIPDDVTTGPAKKDIVITINKANQTVTFAPLEPAILNVTNEVTLTATASTDLPVLFTSSNPAVASIEDNVLTVHTVGTTTITASQEGNLNYQPAATERLFTVTTITETTADEPGALQVYPVPAREYITIQSSGNQSQTTVSIMDVSGRIVRELTPAKTDEQMLRVYVGDLNPGLYYLRLNNGKKQAYRIVKN